MKKHVIFLLVVFFAVWFAPAALGAIIVGRVGHVEGRIFRYMDVDQSWVETFTEAPAGTLDTLKTDTASRAEILFPNGVTVRLDKNATVEIVDLAEAGAVFSLDEGLARFYNGSEEGSVLVETGIGTMTLGPESAADVLADSTMTAVSTLSGSATFQTKTGDAESVEIISAGTTLEISADAIVAANGPIDRNWDDWCAAREERWSEKRLVSSNHLPETMQEYAYTLEPYGSWQRVYYRGYYYWAWRPHQIEVGWGPYTTGFWHDWQGVDVWIDHNPWGWVTHHHGHWLHLQGAWMWTPYVHVALVPGITVSGLHITFGKRFRPYWHPGRVRWIAHNSHVGWIPLAPWEVYYGPRRWGPRSRAITHRAGFSLNVNLARHHHIDHAVIIPRKHLHPKRADRLNRYRATRIRSVDKRGIIKNYKGVAWTKQAKHRTHETQKLQARKAEQRVVQHRKERGPVVGKKGATALFRQANREKKHLRFKETAKHRERPSLSNRPSQADTQTTTLKRQQSAPKRERLARVESSQNSLVSKREARQTRKIPAKSLARIVPRQFNRTEAKDSRQTRKTRQGKVEAVVRNNTPQREKAFAAGQSRPETGKQRQQVKKERQKLTGKKEPGSRAPVESRQNSAGRKRETRQAGKAPAKSYARNVPRQFNRTAAKDSWQREEKGLFPARHQGFRFR
jgi:hypothetical protein